MTARDLINQALVDGVQIALGEAGKLRYSGPESAVSRWLPAIRENKDSLLELLAADHGNQKGEAIHWRLHFPDREPLEIFRSPPASLHQVLADNPGALDAEPILDDPVVPEIQATRTANRWLIHWRDRDGIIARYDRPVPLAHVLAEHPLAIAAEPFETP